MEEKTARTAPAPGSDRASDARHVARSGVLQLLSALGQGIMPVTHILIARLFPTIVFGGYQACLALLDVLSRAGLAGSMHGMHRFIPAHRAAGQADLEQRALGTGIRLTVGISTVIALALALLATPIARAWSGPRLAVALPIMAPALLFATTTLVLVAATMGAKVARMSLYVRGIAEPLLLLVAVLVAWRFGGTLRSLAIAHTTSAALVAAMAVLACARVFGGPYLRQSLRTPRHPAFIRFALPLGVSDLMSAVLNRADTFIVASFGGLDTLAVYTAAEFITRLIANPRYLFDYIIAPVISEALQTHDRARVRYNLALVTRWVITACAPIAVTVIVLRVEILGLYGRAFTTGASALVILAIHHLIVGCLGLTPYVVSMGGRTRLYLINNVCAAALNIALGVVLVPRFGINGAAIAVLASVGSFQVALTIEAWILERVHPFTMAQLKPVGAALVALAVEAALHRFMGGGAARVTAVVAAGAGSYFAALLAFGLAPEERDGLRRLAGRLGLGRLTGRSAGGESDR
jgi:O-antigen/teichoic acid export membrane protein